MRLFTTGSTMPGQATWFDDPRSYAAWDYAGAAAIPVCMQMTPQGFPQLRGLMERFPKVRIILDHLARPKLVDGRRSQPTSRSSISPGTARSFSR
jgi:predicted TIM-barrel fold metal-dependent hydrolase